MTRKQRQANSIAGVDASDDIRERCAQFCRRSVRISGQIHNSRFTLGDNVIAGPVAVWTGVSESGNRTVHGAGVCFRNCLIAKAEFVENPRPEVLNKNIGALNEFPKNPASLCRPEVEPQTLLIPVDREEVCADTPDKWGTPLPAIVA